MANIRQLFLKPSPIEVSDSSHSSQFSQNGSPGLNCEKFGDTNFAVILNHGASEVISKWRVFWKVLQVEEKKHEWKIHSVFWFPWFLKFSKVLVISYEKNTYVRGNGDFMCHTSISRKHDEPWNMIHLRFCLTQLNIQIFAVIYQRYTSWVNTWKKLDIVWMLWWIGYISGYRKRYSCYNFNGVASLDVTP